jgi:integrase
LLGCPQTFYLNIRVASEQFFRKEARVMAQVTVLTDPEIRRVFRIVETTRHADRNRLAFVMSIYAGLRVGEIAALTIGDVANRDGEIRREIKFNAHQTKGSKGRTVVLSIRVRKEIEAYLQSRTSAAADVQAALKRTADFYAAWGDVTKVKFDAWWKEKGHLFEEKHTVRRLAHGEPPVDPNALVVEIPLTESPTTLIKRVKTILQEAFVDRERASKKSKKRRLRCTA